MRAISLLFLLTTGCYQSHLYVQQEWVDASYLASQHVHTPDPRAEHPPQGQRLVIAWDFPRSEFQEGLSLLVTVRLWNNEEEEYFFPVERKRGITDLYFPNSEEGQEQSILTYRVLVLNRSGEVVDQWVHHFWTELINLDAPQRKRSAVSLQPKQGSVIDTP